MSIKEYTKDGTILARYIPSNVWNDGLSFFSKDEEFIQVGSWGYNKGKELLAHTHNEVDRIVYRTQEVLYIRKGSVKAKIFDMEDALFEEIQMKEGDTIILLRGGHGYEILEDGTQVLEIKNGPYVGAERDRRRI